MESKNLAEEVVHNEPVIIIFPDIGMYSHIVDSRLRPPCPRFGAAPGESV